MADTLQNNDVPVDAMPPVDPGATPVSEIGAADINPDELAHEMALSDNDAKLSEVDSLLDKYKMHRNPNASYKYMFDDILYEWYRKDSGETDFVFSSYRNWLLSTNFTSMDNDNDWAEFILSEGRDLMIVNRVRVSIEGKSPLAPQDNPAPEPEIAKEDELPEISSDDVTDGLSDKAEVSPEDISSGVGESELSDDDLKDLDEIPTHEQSDKSSETEEVAAEELADELKKEGLDIDVDKVKEVGKS